MAPTASAEFERGIAEPDDRDDSLGVDPAGGQPDGWATSSNARSTRTLSSSNTPMQPAGAGPSTGPSPTRGRPTVNVLDIWTMSPTTSPPAALRERHLVDTRARTGAVQPTSNPLWIGGNQPCVRRVLPGLIGEVHVYDRALPPADIQSDDEHLVVPIGPDTTPPSTPSGPTATAASATRSTSAGRPRPTMSASPATGVERCAGATCTTSPRSPPPPRTSTTPALALDHLPLPGARRRRPAT